MRLLTLVLALFAISARCATIPAKITGEIEKKIEDAINGVLDKENEPSSGQPNQQEKIEQSISISSVDNSLKKVDVAEIPVKVVVENVHPSVKSAEQIASNQEIVKIEEEIKRPEVDLEHPGIPQHQEHDSQNPEHHEHEGDMSSFIKQNVIKTQVVFNNEVQNLQNKIKSLKTTDQQMNEIQEQLKRLQESFKEQIEKLSETVRKYIPETEEKPALRTLPEDIKAEGKQDSSTDSSTAQPSPNPIAQYFQQLQQSISSNIAQMQEQMQSYFNNNNQQSSQPANASSDEGASTSRPSLWQSITNIFNPANNNQANQQQADTPVSQPNRPIVQAIQSNIQNNPIYQSVASVFNPNRPATNRPETQKPESAPSAQASQSAAEKPDVPSEGTNSEPAKPEAEKQKPDAIQYAQSGPIKQILIEKNPIVQGIAGAVQRIQQTYTNPDKPREVTRKDEKAAAPLSEEKKHTYYSGNQHIQTEHNHISNDCSRVKEKGDQPEKPVEIAMEPLKEEPPKGDQSNKTE